MIPPKMPPRGVQPPLPAAREAWSLDRFVARYNAVADERGGWYFEKTPANVRRVEQDWAVTKTATIAEFAEAWFRFDQRT